MSFFREGFPYSNFHELNMDWIIKIAKDFLDQYTHIQEIIEQGIIDIGDKTDTGLADLQDKYEALDTLLQAWYDTHSTDIADQLASALEDLNSWYTTHETYLDNTLTTKIAEFNASADAKAERTIESIPDDYTSLTNKVSTLKDNLDHGYFPGTFPIESLMITNITGNIFNPEDPFATSGYLNDDGTISPNDTYITTGYAKVTPGEVYFLYGILENNQEQARFALTYDENYQPVRYLSYAPTVTIASGEKFLRVSGMATRIVGASLKSSRPAQHKAVIPSKFLDIPSENKKEYMIQVSFPDNFKWVNNPLKNKIYQNYNGETFIDFDAETFKNNIGTILYVSPDGSNSNTGGYADPLFSIAEAYSRNADTIILRGGVYDAQNCMAYITRDINIIAEQDETPILSSNSASVFIAHPDYLNVYYVTRGTISSVFDLRFTNKYGYYTPYEKVSTIDEVNNTAGTYAHLNNVFYIHCINGSDPNALQAEHKILLGSSLTPINVLGHCSVYLENLIVFNGDRALFAERPANDTGDINIYGKNCIFYGSKNTNCDCVQLKGTTLSYFQNCEAVYSKKDGFNYHSYNGTIPNAIEINCKGRFNGTDINAANQGSTIHDGGSIIRIGCFYTNNHGSNVADEGTNTHAIMIGCVAIESEARYDSQNMGYYAYPDVYSWVDSCVSIHNKYALGGAGNIYVRNPRFTGDIAPEDTTYTIY